jgi:hypothetical protein
MDDDNIHGKNKTGKKTIVPETRWMTSTTKRKL